MLVDSLISNSLKCLYEQVGTYYQIIMKFLYWQKKILSE